MTALLATFVSLKTMVDGGVRITLDMQCTLADIAPMGLIPGVPFGLARITGASSIAPVEPDPPKEKAGMLCIMACTFCTDPVFSEWAGTSTDEQAKKFILDACEIKSRKELDTCPDAAELFHLLVRKPFMAWKAKQ